MVFRHFKILAMVARKNGHLCLIITCASSLNSAHFLDDLEVCNSYITKKVLCTTKTQDIYCVQCLEIQQPLERIGFVSLL